MISKQMRLIDAVEKVLKEDKRTHDSSYNWLFVAKVLRELGFEIFIKFDRKMPSPETIFRERREVLNKKNKFPKSFKLEDNVKIIEPGTE